MSDRDLLLSIQAQINDYLGAVTPPPQHESCEHLVTRLYSEELHRAPDPGGFDFWTARCEAGVTEAEIRAVFRASVPHPPVGNCSGPNSLSDQAMHVYRFAEGQYQEFCFNSPGGSVQMFGVAKANTTGHKAYYSVNGGAEQSFEPSGSDFRFEPISGTVAPGVTTIRIKIAGILGEGNFGLQATGAVG